MSPLFEPSPILLAFLAVKTTLYLPALLLLALLRALVASGPARAMAVLALLVALAGITARFVPPLLGLSGGTAAQAAYALANAGNGMALPLVASALMLGSGLLAGTRWRWIDLLHLLLLAALCALWLASA
ncbi:hypothetical protein ACFQ3C_02985 [Seohaeicola saemankumensis]|uniref:Uncharacterized protein n=1 Tax=Seohaeicola saemankumensis TaxID=481181 RepID=A0ABW3T935_9RHOB